MIGIRFEPLSFLLMHGLVDLAFEAHQELEHEHKNYPYAPDWEGYQNSETGNSLRFIAMREDGKLIGYVSILVDKDLHHEGLILATFRDIFVTKIKRGHAAKLVRFAEKQLSEIGVVRTLLGERIQANNVPSQFYKALGYEPQEIIHGKTICKGGVC